FFFLIESLTSPMHLGFSVFPNVHQKEKLSIDGAHYIEFLAKNDQSRRLKVFLSDERLGKLKIPGALVKLFNVKPFITFNDLHHALGTAIDKNKVHRLIDNYTKIGLL